MIGKRLKQIRLARGLTLQQLSDKMNGYVSRAALSKYENDNMAPTAKTLRKLSTALGVRMSYFVSVPDYSMRYLAFRQKKSLTRNKREEIEAKVSHNLEQRIQIQNYIGQVEDYSSVVKSFEYSNLEDVENIAVELRGKWNLGLNPIDSAVNTLENNSVHVIYIDASLDFDGYSVYANNDQGEIVSTAVICQKNIPVDRQRFSLFHELGHLILKENPELDEEKAANRFAGAFLAPKPHFERIVGGKRTLVNYGEVIEYKKYFKMSIQAILYRLRDLAIVSENEYKRWWSIIARNGWKFNEPYPLSPEEPEWLKRNTLRAYAEGYITKRQVENILGTPFISRKAESESKRTALRRLPLDARRKLLEDFYDDNAQLYSEIETTETN